MRPKKQETIPRSRCTEAAQHLHLGTEARRVRRHELIGDRPTPLREGGFGMEVRKALNLRRQWLIEQELASTTERGWIFRRDMLAVLQRRELTRAGAQLSKERGLSYVSVEPGQRVEGVYRRSMNLGSGRFAVIEKSREFTLVPWRPVLDRGLGRQVTGIARGGGISWTIARRRGGPSI